MATPTTGDSAGMLRLQIALDPLRRKPVGAAGHGRLVSPDGFEVADLRRLATAARAAGYDRGEVAPSAHSGMSGSAGNWSPCFAGVGGEGTWAAALLGAGAESLLGAGACSLFIGRRGVTGFSFAAGGTGDSGCCKPGKLPSGAVGDGVGTAGWGDSDGFSAGLRAGRSAGFSSPGSRRPSPGSRMSSPGNRIPSPGSDGSPGCGWAGCSGAVPPGCSGAVPGVSDLGTGAVAFGKGAGFLPAGAAMISFPKAPGKTRSGLWSQGHCRHCVS